MKKIVLLLLSVVLCFSLFCVSSFALTENTVDFLFAEELTFNDSFSGLSDAFSFESNLTTFKGINVMYRGYWVLEYVTIDDNTVPVYSSDTGWLSESFRTLEILSPVPSDSLLFEFMSLNEYNSANEGWFFLIRSILCDSLFKLEYDSLSSELKLSVTLLSLIFTLVVVAVPIYVVVWGLKTILSSRWS